MGSASMPYPDAAYGNTTMGGMPPMSSMPTDAYGDGLPSMNAPQSMSARTSRSNSLIRPGSGVEENRRSMSALELSNNRLNFNDYRAANGLPNNLSHDMSGYGNQQSQGPAVTSAPNQYSYETAMAQNDMAQNNMPIKSENGNSAPYARPTLPNMDGLSNGQDNSGRWNNSYNNEPQSDFLMNSSMASGPPHPGKATGVLTVNDF
jgi:hypothetical protein